MPGTQSAVASPTAVERGGSGTRPGQRRERRGGSLRLCTCNAPHAQGSEQTPCPRSGRSCPGVPCTGWPRGSGTSPRSGHHAGTERQQRQHARLHDCTGDARAAALTFDCFPRHPLRAKNDLALSLPPAIMRCNWSSDQLSSSHDLCVCTRQQFSNAKNGSVGAAACTHRMKDMCTPMRR